MPYRRDHRDCGGINGPGYQFLVKGPQILHRAAAPAGNNQVGCLIAVDPVQRSTDFPLRLYTLYPHRYNQNLC